MGFVLVLPLFKLSKCCKLSLYHAGFLRFCAFVFTDIFWMTTKPPKADMYSALSDVRLAPTPAAAAKRFLFAAGAGLAISGARPFNR